MRSSRREALAGLTATVLAGGTAGEVLAAGPEAIVPFELTYNQAWTPVKLDGHGWYKFLIDTGAAFFSVDDRIAQSIGLTRRSSEDVLGAVGHTYLNTYIGKDVSIAGVVHDANVSVVGMGALGGMQGLIPAALLGVVRFDFAQKRMHLSNGTATRPDGFAAVAREGARTKPGSHQIERDPRPQVRAMLDGRPLKLWIDTGAQTGIYLFSEYVQRANIWDAYGKPDVKPVEGVSGSGLARYVKAGVLDVGGVKFESPHMSMQDPTERSGRAFISQEGMADGLLGMELLRRLDLVIDPFGSEIFLRPNALFNDVERRNRAGLEVRMVDGKPTAIEVVEKGPAWNAGVRQGDLIVGYAGGDNSVAGLMWLLEGPAGQAITLEVSHEGQAKQIVFALEEPK